MKREFPSQTAEEFAKQNFVYCGKGAVVCCFCGLFAKTWLREDSPYMVHKFSARSCVTHNGGLKSAHNKTVIRTWTKFKKLDESGEIYVPAHKHRRTPSGHRPTSPILCQVRRRHHGQSDE